MPFLNPGRHYGKFASVVRFNNDVTMVKLSNGLHPMHGVYSKGCLSVLRRMIEADQLRIQDLLVQKDLTTNILGQEVVQEIDPQFKSFLNVNTPADFEIAERLIRQ